MLASSCVRPITANEALVRLLDHVAWPPVVVLTPPSDDSVGRLFERPVPSTVPKNWAVDTAKTR